MLEILTWPHYALRVICAPVNLNNLKSLQNTIDEMFTAMYSNGGIGLAAAQVGILKTFFIADIGPKKWVFINPSIEWYSKETWLAEEGCLSFPGKTIEIERPDEIVVSATDRDGKFFRLEAQGLLARVIQHECCHLRGQVITDYAKTE